MPSKSEGVVSALRAVDNGEQQVSDTPVAVEGQAPTQESLERAVARTRRSYTSHSSAMKNTLIVEARRHEEHQAELTQRQAQLDDEQADLDLAKASVQAALAALRD